MDPNLNERFDLNEALAQVDAGLRGQSEATHKGALDRAALEAERSVTALRALQRGLLQSPPLPPRSQKRKALTQALTRARDLALYNQLLLRYSLTAWAAQRLEKRRGALVYDDRGRPHQALSSAPPALNVSHRGVL